MTTMMKMVMTLMMILYVDDADKTVMTMSFMKTTTKVVGCNSCVLVMESCNRDCGSCCNFDDDGIGGDGGNGSCGNLCSI